MQEGAHRVLGGVDVLMITYNRPEYVALTLPRLLESCREQDRVWVWHNGDDERTLDVVGRHHGHPRLHRFHHSRENVRLREPTNWLWSEAGGDFVSKVDDDCLVDPRWITVLEQAHRHHDRFGALGTWRFHDEDLVPGLVQRKLQQFGEQQILRNHWVQGSGYLLRREAQRSGGLLREDESWTQYCVRLAHRRWVNGWVYPFVPEEHLDDPRSPRTLLVDDDALRRYLPLSAQRRGSTTLEAWRRDMTLSAREVQEAPLGLWRYTRGWRAVQRAGRVVGRVRRNASYA